MPLRVIWEAAQRGEFEIWTSTFSYLEVLYVKNAFGEAYSHEKHDAAIFAALESPYVRRVQLDVEVAKLARTMKRLHHPMLGKRSDAIHLATAAYYNVEELHTWDGSDLLPLNGKILRRDGVFLPVRIPGPEMHGPLFKEKEAADDEKE